MLLPHGVDADADLEANRMFMGRIAERSVAICYIKLGSTRFSNVRA
jgi:hypothetical protein